MPGKLQLGINGPLLSAVGTGTTARGRYESENRVLLGLQALPVLRTEQDILSLPGTNLNGTIIEVNDSFQVDGEITLSSGRSIEVKSVGLSVFGFSLADRIVGDAAQVINVTSNQFEMTSVGVVNTNAANRALRLQADTCIFTDVLFDCDGPQCLDLQGGNANEFLQCVFRGRVVENVTMANITFTDCVHKLTSANAAVRIEDGASERMIHIGSDFELAAGQFAVEVNADRLFDLRSCGLPSGAGFIKVLSNVGDFAAAECSSLANDSVVMRVESASTISRCRLGNNQVKGSILQVVAGATFEDLLMVGNIARSNHIVDINNTVDTVTLNRMAIVGNESGGSLIRSDSGGSNLVNNGNISANVCAFLTDNNDWVFTDVLFNGNELRSNGPVVRVASTNTHTRISVVNNIAEQDIIQIDGANATITKAVIANNICKRHVFFVDDPSRITESIVSGNLTEGADFISSGGAPFDAATYTTVTARGNRASGGAITDFG